MRNAHTDAAGGRQTTGFSYAAGLFSAVTDGRGHTTGLGYAGAATTARLETVTDRRGKAWSFSHGTPDATGGRVTTATDPTGAKVRYTVSGRAALADGRTAGSNITTGWDSVVGDLGTRTVLEVGLPPRPFVGRPPERGAPAGALGYRRGPPKVRLLTMRAAR